MCAQTVHTYYHNNLVTGSEASSGNIHVYENDNQIIQCVFFIVSLGTAAVAVCPGACFLHDKAAVVSAAINSRPYKGVK
jgi:hypothetical protein